VFISRKQPCVGSSRDRAHARLAEKRRLLIAGDAGDRSSTPPIFAWHRPGRRNDTRSSERGTSNSAAVVIPVAVRISKSACGSRSTSR